MRESFAFRAAAFGDLKTGAAGRDAGPRGLHGVADLGAEVLVNDRSVTFCSTCGSMPLTQAEPSIAAYGPLVVASWNDNRARCTNQGSQGLGFSVDAGVTWTDLGFVPFTSEGSQYRGDPVVAVNRRTGNFYVTGLDRMGTSSTGVATLRGHIAGGAFVVDANHRTAVAATGDFLDKCWMAVDSLSGNVYVTWSNFTSGTTRVELQRLNAALNPLGPRQVLFEDPGAQGTYPTVGPDGELYVPWTIYRFHFDPLFPSLLVRRSDDFGATFGPVNQIAEIEGNVFSGAPGSKRQFGSLNIAIAVDMTSGPHRGRVYATWDECVHYKDAPFGAHTAAFEAENNGFIAAANPFTVGGKLRGSINSSSDADFWTFEATAGQTLVIRPDTLTTLGFQFPIRVMCGADTTGLGTYRILSFATTDPNSGGVVCTLPATGTYYLMCGGAMGQLTTNYVLSTAFDTPSPGERARDARDQFVSYSDDGATWSTPARLNDDPPLFHGCFPTVAVDDLGRAHVFFFNYRNGGACGDLSDQYITSSGDGGLTWGANRRLTDVSSYWGFLSSCSNVNHGDYTQLAADGTRLYACFPDARMGDPDIFVDVTTQDSHGDCPAPQQAPPNSGLDLGFELVNDGSVPTSLSWQLEDTQGWISGAIPGTSGTQILAAGGGSLAITATVSLPDGCLDDSTVVRFITSDPFIPGHFDTCRAIARCGTPSTSIPVPVSLALGLEGSRPNPTSGEMRVAFTLPESAPARLTLVDLAGRQYGVREVGHMGPGRHVVSLACGRIPSGMYWLRLSQSGRALVRRAVVVK